MIGISDLEAMKGWMLGIEVHRRSSRQRLKAVQYPEQPSPESTSTERACGLGSRRAQRAVPSDDVLGVVPDADKLLCGGGTRVAADGMQELTRSRRP